MTLSRIARTLLILALAASIGLHWMLLQTVAWVGMFADFSRTNSLPAAVTMTFDGNHPCPLCLAVQEGEGKEKQPVKADLLKGKDLTCFTFSEVTTCLPPISSGIEIDPAPTPPARLLARSDSPPLPPPRHRA